MPKQGKVGKRWGVTAGLCLPLLTVSRLYFLTEREAILSTALKKHFWNCGVFPQITLKTELGTSRAER